MIYSEKIQHLTDEQISKCAVCYRHFADDDYLVTFRVRKLKRGIAPSLNLPNKPASSVPTIKQEVQTSAAASTSAFAVKEEREVTETPKTDETTEIALFEDTPEEVKPCLFNQPQTSPDKRTEQTNSTAETFTSDRIKLNRRKMSRRKRVKLSTAQLPLLRRKQQAKRYEKTPTIQKLLSFLTPAEIASIRTSIRKSRYSPKVYVRVYHDIAQRKTLGQL